MIDTVNRIPTVTTATTESRKPRRRAKPVERTTIRRRDGLARWCLLYVTVSAVLSMALNAWAGSRHAPEGLQWAAVVLGAVIPLLVLLLGKVAGLTHRRRHYSLARITGAIGVAVLMLSIAHCYEAIAALTGCHAAVAVLLALGIDAGMVACEVTSVVISD